MIHKAMGRQNGEAMVNFEPKTSFLVICAKLTVYIKRPSVGVRAMVFNATFNNISVISWWSVLLVEESGVPLEKTAYLRKSLTNLLHKIVSSTPRHERDSNSQG